MNSCVNSPEDGPVGPKHVEIRRYMNKIETVTSVCFSFHMLEAALLCVNLVWIYKLCKHQLYTHCVCCLYCVLKYSKQETLLCSEVQ